MPVSSKAAVFRNLNERQKAFVNAYVSNGFNGTQAALSAGYTPKAAGQTAHRMLNSGKIKQAINFLKERSTVGTPLTTSYVVEQLMKIVENSRSDSAKVAALRLLGMYTGMWGDGTSNVNVNVINANEESRDVLAAIPTEKLKQLREQWETVSKESGIEVQRRSDDA